MEYMKLWINDHGVINYRLLDNQLRDQHENFNSLDQKIINLYEQRVKNHSDKHYFNISYDDYDLRNEYKLERERNTEEIGSGSFGTVKIDSKLNCVIKKQLLIRSSSSNQSNESRVNSILKEVLCILKFDILQNRVIYIGMSKTNKKSQLINRVVENQGKIVNIYFFMPYMTSINLSKFIKNEKARLQIRLNNFVERYESSLDKVGALGLDNLRIDFSSLVYNVLHLHDKGVCHRDIKPLNIILVKNDRNNLYCYLVDYGLSYIKHSNSQNVVDRYSESGTAAYMPKHTYVKYNERNNTDGKYYYSFRLIDRVGVSVFEYFYYIIQHGQNFPESELFELYRFLDFFALFRTFEECAVSLKDTQVEIDAKIYIEDITKNMVFFKDQMSVNSNEIKKFNDLQTESFRGLLKNYSNNLNFNQNSIFKNTINQNMYFNIKPQRSELILNQSINDFFGKIRKDNLFLRNNNTRKGVLMQQILLLHQSLQNIPDVNFKPLFKDFLRVAIQRRNIGISQSTTSGDRVFQILRNEFQVLLTYLMESSGRKTKHAYTYNEFCLSLKEDEDQGDNFYYAANKNNFYERYRDFKKKKIGTVMTDKILYELDNSNNLINFSNRLIEMNMAY